MKLYQHISDDKVFMKVDEWSSSFRIKSLVKSRTQCIINIFSVFSMQKDIIYRENVNNAYSLSICLYTERKVKKGITNLVRIYSPEMFNKVLVIKLIHKNNY